VIRPAPVIAVVDDEETVRRALGRLLEACGFSVETFDSGETFLRSLADHEPDCLILDLHMPRMDGFAVAGQLARRSTRVPVVVITGHDTAESQQRVKSAGIATYLRKPVDENVLIGAVRDALGQK
jgi:FixJ family two-component response regulator